MKRILKKRFLWLSLIVVGLSIGLLSFTARNDFKIVKNLDIFYSLFRELNLYYVEDVDPEVLVKEAIDGMLSSLDPYTTYISPEDKENYDFMTTGHYGGVGAIIRTEDKSVIVVEPYQGFPADKAGLKAGDIILKIDNNDAVGKNVKEVSEMLKGVPKTTVTVLVKKPFSNDTITYTLTREEIIVKSVPYYKLIDNNIGYIRLDKFTQGAHIEMKAALSDLKAQGATSILLDLRNNPGGLLIEAVDIVNLFVEKGTTIVDTRGKITKFNNKYETRFEPVDTKIPMAVLVNGNSASASEIIAGALQDLDRAVIVGERTFGKGLVQTTRPLSYDAQLKVTSSKYYIPSGRCIQKVNYSKNKSKEEDSSKVFFTKKGRKVYEAKGINPDIEEPAEELSKIAFAVLSKNVIFDFVNYYLYKNPIHPTLDSIQVSDALYAEFCAFTQDKEIEYETETYKAVKDLIKTAKDEKYYDLVTNELTNLEKLLALDKNNDLKIFEKELRQLIREELSVRLYYNSGLIHTTISVDKQVAAAKKILINQKTYEEVFVPLHENTTSN